MFSFVASLSPSPPVSVTVMGVSVQVPDVSQSTSCRVLYSVDWHDIVTKVTTLGGILHFMFHWTLICKHGSSKFASIGHSITISPISL